MKTRIVIVTGSGGILGTGHIQRMLKLAVELNCVNSFSASIYLKQNIHPFPEKFTSLLTDAIPPDTSLIIRDMRDSSIDEIMSLRNLAPVLAIDDSGEGRDYADFAINLLPVPSGILKNVKPDISRFLYGYNFTEGIESLKKTKPYNRDIDVTVYAGYEPSPGLVSSIRESIPENAYSVLLAGGRANSLTGKSVPPEITYAEVVSRSKILITHFGLTMFEAHACGCSIAALNPTPYHRALTDIIEKEFNIIYSSEYSLLSPVDLHHIIEKELHIFTERNISLDDIINKINTNTESFIDYIKQITK